MSMVPIADLVDDHLARDLDHVTGFISECTDRQVLLDLNQLICRRVKLMQKQRAQSFTNGDMVRFTISGKKRKTLNGEWEGSVTSIHGRRVGVFAIKRPHGKKDKFVNWTVSPEMLVLVPRN